MITIVEDTPNKLSGVTSLHISFSRRPSKEELDILKSGDAYDYDANTHIWELPLPLLSFLLDSLTFYDDITFKVFHDGSADYVIKNKAVLQPKTKSYKHQEEAVEYGLNNDKWLLLDAPGLGKSKSLINLAEELKVQRGIEHCLVICGINTLKKNWEKEINIHSNLDSMIVGKRITRTGNVVYDSIAKRAEQLMNPIKEFFIIINIESLRSDAIIKAIQKSCNKIGMMIFDECHKAKGWASKQGENLLKLESQYMVAATGTLLLNSPLDAYVPLAWIGKEKKNNITRYKQTYCLFDPESVGVIIGYRYLELLKDEIDSCSLRRTKDIIADSLPVKTIIDEYIDMEDDNYKFYKEVEAGIKASCEKVSLKSTSFKALIIRMRQATSCPQVLTTKNLISPKIERCVDLVSEIVSNNEKVVVFSEFKEPVYQLQELLKEYNPLIGTGDMKDEVVQNNIDMFQEDDVHKVYIGTIDKMGTGFTLTRARYMIFIDQPWTEALYTQASDRIHRIGADKSKPLFIYNLICDNTIDVIVSRVIKRKKALSDYTIDNIDDEETLNTLKKYILDL